TAHHERAAADMEEAIALSRELGDTPALGDALFWLSSLRRLQGRTDAVISLAEEAVAVFLAAGNARRAMEARSWLLTATLARGEVVVAEALTRANRAHASVAGRHWWRIDEAQLAETRGDYAGARKLWEEHTQG